jgi:membrane protease YdiL (CAAX protease family)
LNRERRLHSGWWIAIFFAVLAALLVPLILFARDEAGEVSIAVQALAVLIASLICQALRRRPIGELIGKLNWRWPRDVLAGGLLGAVLMAAPALLLVVIGAVSFSPGSNGFAPLGQGALLFVGVAAVEELTFRGFVFQRLLDGVGVWPAQIIVAFFFVLTHSSALQAAGPIGYLAAANICLASLMFGLAFIRTRSLAMPFGLHFAANFVQGSVLGFGVSGGEEQGALNPVLQGPTWLTGGDFGLEASVPGLICVILMIVILLRWPRTAENVGANGAARRSV